MRFPAAPSADAKKHALELLASPGDRRVEGYPVRIVGRADASVALERGHRPIVLLFYDDSSRSSDLQAAEFLPVLVEFADRVEVVPVNVEASNTWTPAERKLVRRYYMSVVPTTVVLAADRRPLLLKFQRISAATLEASLEKAVAR